MSEALSERLTHNLRLDLMQTGLLGSYRMKGDDWEQRYRIEAARLIAGDVPTRPRRDQQAIFEAQRRAAAARHPPVVCSSPRQAV